MPKFAAKVDSNQSEIVGALREVGASVQTLAAVGRGVPDLLVGFRSVTHLLEVKSKTAKKRNEGKTTAQVDWHRQWRGRPVVIVRNTAEALLAIGVESYGDLHARIVGNEATAEGGDTPADGLTKTNVRSNGMALIQPITGKAGEQ